MNGFHRKFMAAVREAMIEFMAKERPSTLFEQAFFDLRDKAKKLKNTWEEHAATVLEGQLLQDLKSRGVQVIEGKMSLGQYRGSRFVTSFKLRIQVKDEVQAESVAEYLRGKYSPKWKVKSVTEEGVADLNVR